jgi:hypothetical protein
VLIQRIYKLNYLSHLINKVLDILYIKYQLI